MQETKSGGLDGQNNGTMSVKMGMAEALTARRLTTPRTISLSGEAHGEGVFDGSKDISIFTTIELLTNEELERMLI